MVLLIIIDILFITGIIIGLTQHKKKHIEPIPELEFNFQIRVSEHQFGSPFSDRTVNIVRTTDPVQAVLKWKYEGSKVDPRCWEKLSLTTKKWAHYEVINLETSVIYYMH